MVGILKGYDQLLNLVLDEATEFLRGEEHPAAHSVQASPFQAALQQVVWELC